MIGIPTWHQKVSKQIVSAENANFDDPNVHITTFLVLLRSLGINDNAKLYQIIIRQEPV